MNTKRVDQLHPGDRIRYLHSTWRVTRVRPGHMPTMRDIRLRDDAEPHYSDERCWPNDTRVEVVSDE